MISAWGSWRRLGNAGTLPQPPVRSRPGAPACRTRRCRARPSLDPPRRHRVSTGASCLCADPTWAIVTRTPSRGPSWRPVSRSHKFGRRCFLPMMISALTNHGREEPAGLREGSGAGPEAGRRSRGRRQRQVRWRIIRARPAATTTEQRAAGAQREGETPQHPRADRQRGRPVDRRAAPHSVRHREYFTICWARRYITSLGTRILCAGRSWP